MFTDKQIAFHQEIIDSINKYHFNMGQWLLSGQSCNTATCETAACIAGHIEAVRADLAKKLIPDFSYTNNGVLFRLDHAGIASEIYLHETGEECQFDFHAVFFKDLNDIEHVLRDDAISHILGTHPEWPQLDV